MAPALPNIASLVRALSVATFLEWLGASAVLPILPLYLSGQGASDFVIGLAMAAFFVAGVIVQYPVGRLGDRIGQNRVLTAALLCLALGSLGFLLPVGPGAEVALRFLQGTGAAAAEVASLSLIGQCVPQARRGSAYSAIFGAQIGALAIAPLVGSIIGIGHMKLLFLAGAVAAVLACAPVVFVARRAERITRSASLASGPPTRAVRLRAMPALQGAFVAAVIAGLVTGVYETSWTLLLELRHASSWQIGLSWCLFCIPFVAMSVPAGRMADRLDRRWLAAASLFASIGLLFAYPFISSLALVIALGASEGLGVAVAYPAVQSLLTQLAPPAQVGETQGLFSTLQTGAIAVSAGAGGALFGAASWLPFIVVGSVCAVLLTTLPYLWRTVPGRVTARDLTPTLSGSSEPNEPPNPPDHAILPCERPGGLHIG